ncbi:uncharacterized protein LOC125517453 [Triticum urartu]|uniref:Uncharacterized protein n=1 Tax=Triticum urartu TaxID=4572 RepID=A0A8R7QTL7_TRIUA|nr:uncharacterized protein LOC123087585 [Triticum aestivum]XP_048538610.1 uncharacterized protein LOC125517453 [Triticum urartu]
MARPYHLTLLSVFSFLLLTGLVTADLSGENKVGKIVTMTVQYPAAGSPPGEKTTISAHYVDENGGGDRRFNLDCDDDEPLGFAMKYLITTLEGIRDTRESRSEL